MISSWMAAAMLADLPAPGGYIDMVRWAVLLAGAVGWLVVCQWVDKDTLRLRFHRYAFNGLVVGCGALGIAAWLWLPMFWIGLLVYLLLVGGSSIVYVLLRNRIVSPNSQVLTLEHLTRLFAGRLPQRREPPPVVPLSTLTQQPIEGLGQDDPLFEGFVTGQELLAEAIGRRASQAALAPADRGVQTWFTVDGVRSQDQPLDRRTADLVIAYFKKISGLDVNDRRRPQAAKVRAAPPDQALTVEIRTSGSRAGEAMLLNLVDEAHKLTLDTLGLTPRQSELLSEFRKRPNGIVLIAAGDKVGSTTTLYGILTAHDVFTNNIQTLEMRPEAELDNIRQHRVAAEGSATEGSFAKSLRSIIRTGPDVVGVSMCRDKETAQLIAKSAADRMRFYVEMSAKDTFTLLARWAGLVGDLDLAISPLQLVVAQVLVRKLCPDCREAYRPDPQVLRKFNLSAERIERLYRPPTQPAADRGGHPIPCQRCQGTGYFGLTGVFEMLEMNDDLRQMAIRNASANEIKKYCRSTQKMLYLTEEALRKVVAGETSINEVLRVMKEREG